MNKFYNMDCMEYMKTVPDKFFELAIVDPPYGIGDFSMKTGGGKIKGPCSSMKVSWNNSTPDENYFKELKRISEKQIIWGANYYNCFSGNGGAYIWYKNIGHKSLSQCEIASVSWRKNVGYFAFKKLAGFIPHEKYIHPCQKPVEVYRDILQNYAKPGDKIFDSHVGSASSIIACIDEKHEYVGCELDKDYYSAAFNRIEIHKEQLRLF